MKKIILLFIYCLFSGHLFSQDSAYARHTMNELCSDKFNGRGYYNNGAVLSAKYIASEMKKAGLHSPRGAKKYLQKFSFYVNSIEEAKLIFNGKELIPGKDFLFPADMETSFDSAHASGIISEMTLKDTQWFQRLVSEIRSIPKGVYYTGFIFIDTLSPQTEKKYKTEIDYIISKFKTVRLVRKLTYTVATNKSFWTKIEILHSAVDGLWNHAGVKIAYDVKSKFFKTNQYNVAGILKGKSRPDSFMVICAHYDHLGRQGNAVFPGANDNACGVAMMLDLARYYSKNRPEYSIVFIAFGGEEAGLIGSRHYSHKPLHNLMKTRFLLNLDLVGSGETGMTVVNATVFQKEFGMLDSINRRHQYLKEIRKRGKAANSDHYFFTELGIPSFFWYLSGPRNAYHDVDDIPSTVSMARYNQTFQLIKAFFAEMQ